MLNIEKFIKEFEKEYLKQNSKNYTDSVIRTLRQCFKSKTMNNFDVVEHVNDFLSAQECKATTINLKKKHITYFLEFLETQTSFKYSKRQIRKIQNANKMEHKSIDDETVKLFDEFCSTDLLKSNEKLVYWIFRENGFRLQEFNAIDWEKVKSIIKESDKTKAILVEFFPQKNSNLRLLRIRPKYFDLVLRCGKTKNKNTLLRTFQNISQKASTFYKKDLSLTSHNLRHAFITQLSDKGLRAEEIQKYTGHKNVAVLVNTYINSNPELIKNGFSTAQEMLFKD